MCFYEKEIIVYASATDDYLPTRLRHVSPYFYEFALNLQDWLKKGFSWGIIFCVLAVVGGHIQAFSFRKLFLSLRPDLKVIVYKLCAASKP